MKIRRSFTSLFLVLLLTAANLTKTSAADEMILRVKPGAELETVLALLNAMLVDEVPGARTYLVSVPSLPFLLPTGVEYLEPNQTLTVSLPDVLELGVLAASDDTAPHWYGAQPALQVVRSNEARGYATGLGVVVANIDARFDTSHPALTGHLTEGRDFVSKGGDGDLDQSSAGYMYEDDGDLDQSSAGYMYEQYESVLDQSSAGYMYEYYESVLDQSSAGYMYEEAGLAFLEESVVRVLTPTGAAYSHGTFTAGLIAVTAPEAMIMPIRAFDDEGRADVFTLAKAIRYAVTNGADVINMSWGTLVDTRTLKNAIEFADRKDVVLVASAGNSNTNLPRYPAAYPEVMAVVATNELDRKAAFSNYGSHVYVDAPGVNIFSAYPGGLYGVKSGTSFSAPMVSGQAALLRSMQVDDVMLRIGGTSVEIDDKNPGYAGQLGLGRASICLKASLHRPIRTTRHPDKNHKDNERYPL